LSNVVFNGTLVLVLIAKGCIVVEAVGENWHALVTLSYYKQKKTLVGDLYKQMLLLFRFENNWILDLIWQNDNFILIDKHANR
jgi:hypothetical protein